MVLAGLLTVGPGEARVLGVRPAEEALLLGLSKSGPGAHAAGIYEVAEGKLGHRIVTNGSCPAWAADRRRFAFTSAGALWVADLDKMETTEIRTGGLFSISAMTPFPVRLWPAWRWVMGGTAVAAWRQTSGPPGERPPGDPRDGMAWLPLVIPINDDVAPLQPLVAVVGWDIGEVTFSPDGKWLAYERFRLIPGIGRVDQSVWTMRREDGASSRLQLDGVADDATLANPAWSSTDDRLAVDVIEKNGTRTTYIVERATGRQWRVPRLQSWNNWSAVMEWSPAADALLVAEGSVAGCSLRSLVLNSTPYGEAPTAARSIGDRPMVFDARWSPDGSRIATVQGSSPNWTDGWDIGLVICDRANRREVVQVPEDLRVDSLDW